MEINDVPLRNGAGNLVAAHSIIHFQLISVEHVGIGTDFDGGGGVTGMVVLAESQMSVHTWPEKRYVTVDVYVCSYTQDNRPRARELYQALLDSFQPASENSHSVERL